MDPDVCRQLVTVLAFVVTLAANMAAVLLPLNGQTTQSDGGLPRLSPRHAGRAVLTLGGLS